MTKKALLALACAGALFGSKAVAEDIPALLIGADVTVQVDALGIPSITAETQTDLAFAQGYLHAQDRFFQMDLQRRQASGTLAELFGASTLAADIQSRTLGLRRAALKSYGIMDPGTQQWLNAYADGVNQWLANNPLPPEYAALELTSAKSWSAIDSIVVGKVLAFSLSFSGSDIDNTLMAGLYQQVGAALGFDGAALFTEDTHRIAPIDDRVTVPDFLDNMAAVAATEGGTSANTAARKKPADSFTLGKVNMTAFNLAKSWNEAIADAPLFQESKRLKEGIKGSNEWSVAGSASADGNPLIANDPHLTLDMPPIFTEESHIVTGEQGYTASGVSLPGAPGIIQGCNGNLCWGTTVNPMDVTDYFQETLILNGLGLPTHTVFKGEAEPVQLIFQSFFANQLDGTADNIERLNVPLTGGGVTILVPRRNGPVLSLDLANSSALSVQYTGLYPTRELAAFRKFNQAETLEDFEAGLQDFDVGSQNFMVSDKTGNIAYYTSAEMPIRSDLQDDMAPDGGMPPWMIRDGSGTLNHEWLEVRNPQPQQVLPFEILPFAEMPQVKNPAAGYIANANNDPVGTTLDNNALNQVRPGGGIYYLNPGYTADRMGRIDRELTDLVAAGGVTQDDMAVLQANNQLLDAELFMPFILQAFANASAEGAFPGLAQFLLDPRMVEAGARLGAWDFSTPTGIAEGWDPFDDPGALPEPEQGEIDASVAATLFAVWRGQMIRNTVDATLAGVFEPALEALGIDADYLPGDSLAVSALLNLLETFEQSNGVGASGIPFFNVPDTPNPADQRDILILFSLLSSLDLLASDEFAPAFANSTTLSDYRWGKLHRIVFNHPLGADPFNVPNGGGLSDLAPDLPGVARAGGRGAVDASSHSARADGLNDFMFGAGPARRFVGTLTPDGPVGEEVIPGGRSGVFFSPHYADQLPLWLTNNYHALSLGTDDANAGEVSSFRFIASDAETP
ncbi:MAG: penicillin acylase family protein [Xanthomonadales bacterium]|nr:penicillin acylase family protein [Xanthomonadales bacterium]